MGLASTVFAHNVTSYLKPLLDLLRSPRVEGIIISVVHKGYFYVILSTIHDTPQIFKGALIDNSGSNVTMIVHSLAEKLKLESTEVNQQLVTSGNM